MSNEIVAALRQLDNTNDKDWTTNGAPAMERVSELMGVTPGTVTRVQVTSAAPDCNRDTFDAWIGAMDDDQRTQDDAPEELDANASDQDVREDFNRRIAKLEEEERGLVLTQDATQRQLDIKRREIDRLVVERDNTVPKPSPVQSIKDHLHANLQRRREAHDARNGVDKIKSPLDVTLSNRKRSETRPAAAKAAS